MQDDHIIYCPNQDTFKCERDAFDNLIRQVNKNKLRLQQANQEVQSPFQSLNSYPHTKGVLCVKKQPLPLLCQPNFKCSSLTFTPELSCRPFFFHNRTGNSLSNTPVKTVSNFSQERRQQHPRMWIQARSAASPRPGASGFS